MTKKQTTKQAPKYDEKLFQLLQQKVDTAVEDKEYQTIGLHRLLVLNALSRGLGTTHELLEHGVVLLLLEQVDSMIPKALEKLKGEANVV
jgi:hypothetical protein